MVEHDKLVANSKWDLRDTFLIVALAIYAAVLFGHLLLWLNTVGLVAIMVSEHVHASVVLARPDAHGFLVALFAGVDSRGRDSRLV